MIRRHDTRSGRNAHGWLHAVVLVAACACGLHADSVVSFNEIMYHPPLNEAASEWLELRNQMSVDIDLSGWVLTGGVNYVFAEGTIAAGRGYVVVAGVAVHHLRQAGSAAVFDATWSSLSNWQAAVALVPGTNTVVLWGMSPRATVVASNSIVIVCTAIVPPATLVTINEFMASNNGSVRDEYGNASDWVELFNTNV
jgi:hypothetical protein